MAPRSSIRWGRSETWYQPSEDPPGYIVNKSLGDGVVVFTAIYRDEIIGSVRNVPLHDIEARKNAALEARGVCEKHLADRLTPAA